MPIDRDRIWSVVNQVRAEAAKDPELAERVRREPTTVLRERGLTLREINAESGSDECDVFGTTISSSVPPRAVD